MDELKIEKAVIGGFDWGARTANIVAALWPERVKAMVSVSGYLIGSREANQHPLPPKAEYAWWYQFYFTTVHHRARARGLREIPPRVFAADLGAGFAAMEVRRRDVCTERRCLRQSGSRRDRNP